MFRYNKVTKKLKLAGSRRSRIFTMMLLLISCGLIAYGALSLQQWHSVQRGGVPGANSVATVTPEKPSEQAVPSNYSVPADQPLSISLPTIQAEGFIQKVGVDRSNQMVAPGNINMAGWYVKSVKPGERGLSIINAHVHGVYRKGLFYNLANLKQGDTFSVTYGDHTVRKFQVKRVDKVALKDADRYLYAHYTAIPRQLNLITCGGSYNAKNKTYDGRVIVTATFIN
jgi:LPXTG-site transpeptidase (sortase) family protein